MEITNFLKGMEAFKMNGLNIEINEVVELNKSTKSTLKKDDIRKLQSEMLQIEDVSPENYIKAVKIAHKILALCLTKYRYLSGKFSTSRAEWLTITDSQLIVKRSIDASNILDITFMATMELPTQLPRITASHFASMEKALKLSNAPNNAVDIKKQIIKSDKMVSSSKIITSKLMDAMLTVGKEDTFLTESRSKKVEFGKGKDKGEIILTKPLFTNNIEYSDKQIAELKEKLDKDYILTELDAQNCMLLYSFAKHYQGNFKDNKLFFSMTAIGDFVGKNMKGTRGDSFVESIKRLSRLQIQYEFNGDYNNVTIAKILSAYYGNNFAKDTLQKFTTNYLFAEIAEGTTGVYFAMQFPLMNIFDALGQFEDNIDPRIFAHSNKNEYMIVTIGFKLAAYSFMNKSKTRSKHKNIKLTTLMDSLNIMDSYLTNQNKSRFLNNLCKNINMASIYVKNIKPIKIITCPSELNNTTFTIEYVDALIEEANNNYD